MVQLTIYNNGQRLAKTLKAISLIEIKELMRNRTLSYSIPNTDNARQYIQRGAIYEVGGQKFINKRFKRNSGQDNITDVYAEHVSYRTNKYVIPAGYSFVGTVHDLIQDMLNISGGNVEFSVGNCVNVSGSYSPGNTQVITLRAALWGLTALGVEIDYDNYTINALSRLGADNSKVFKFGRDLCNLDIEDNEDDGTTTYTIDIAALMRMSNPLPGDYFALGDTVIIQDDLIGDEFRGQRIITYERHHDDPTQDRVIIGQFKLDSADTVSAMQVDISTSVQQGDQYSNVSIDHQNGFMAVNAAGTIGVKMNADNCFAVYKISGGIWTLLSELDANGMQAGTLRTINSSVYGIIGDTQDGHIGLQLINQDGNISFCEICELVGGGVGIYNGTTKIQIDSNGVCFFKGEAEIGLSGTTSEGFNFTSGLFTGGGAAETMTGTIDTVNANIIVDRGIITDWTYPSTWSGTIPINNGTNTLHFNGGVLISVS